MVPVFLSSCSDAEVCSNVNFTHLFGFYFSYFVQFERSCSYLLLAVCTEWCSGRMCLSCLSLICDQWHICHQLGQIGNDDAVAQISALKSQKGSWLLDQFRLTLAGRRMEARHYVNSPAGEQSRGKKRKTCFSGEFSEFSEFCLECYWLTITHLFIVQCDVSFFYEWHADLFIL